MAGSTFVYVTFIRTTVENIWSAFTEPAFIKKFWFDVDVETSWQVGAPWCIKFPDGRTADSGEIIEFDPPHRMVIKWRNEFMPDLTAEGYSLCVIEVEAVGEAAKLTVTHSSTVENSKLIGAVSGGWPKILSNLKSLIETGELVLPNTPS
ncbi:MAG: SRPBCC family protein [Rhizobium sp.]